MAMASWGQIFNAAVNAAMGMPAFNNGVVHLAGRVFSSSTARTGAAAAATAIYSLKNYLTTGAAIEGLLPAAIAGIPLGPLNAPLTAFLAWGTLEIAKQVVGAVSTYRQNRSQAAAQQTLAERQAALLGDVDEEILRLNDNAQKPQYQSLALELTQLQAAHGPLRQNLAGNQRADAELIQDRKTLEQFKKAHEKILELQALDQNIQDPANAPILLELQALRAAFAPVIQNLCNPLRTDAQLVQDRAYFEQLKQVRTKILSIKARIKADTPAALSAELQRLVTANNQLDAGNNIQATLAALEVLDQQLELMANVSDKATDLRLVMLIENQKNKLTQIKLKQNEIKDKIKAVKDEIVKLETQKAAIESGVDQGHWYTTKSGRLQAKQAEINTKKDELSQLRDELINSAGLTVQEIDAELLRLRQLPLTPDVNARIHAYEALRVDRQAFDLAQQNHQTEQAEILRGRIQESPFLTPDALDQQIQHLNGDLARLPKVVGPLTRRELRQRLNAIQNTLILPVNPGVLGAQQQAFQQVVAQTQAPAQPAPAAAPAHAAPAQPAQQPQGAPQMLPPIAPAAAGPVDFSIPNPANAQGPRLPLNTCSPFPVFTVADLPAALHLAAYDIVAPLDDAFRKMGSMCLAPALSAALEVPHLVKQLPKTVQARLNKGAERDLFGDSGPGGIGIQNQRDNPQCPPAVLVALLNLAHCFRNPGANAIEVLTDNLRVVEMNLSKMKGLTQENKDRIVEMVILLNLLKVLRGGGTISEASFKSILVPFHNRYSSHLPHRQYGPAAFIRGTADKPGVVEHLEALVMGKESDMVVFRQPQNLKATKKHALVCVPVVLGNAKKVPETVEVEVSGKKAKYKVVSVVETSADEPRLEATSHSLAGLGWSSYNPQRAQRVLADAATRADGHVTFQVGDFNQATLFAVPAN